MAGATARYVPLRPPTEASLQTVSSNEWKLDMAELESAVTPKTKALVSLFACCIAFPRALINLDPEQSVSFQGAHMISKASSH